MGITKRNPFLKIKDKTTNEQETQTNNPPDSTPKQNQLGNEEILRTMLISLMGF